eukprot:757273-Karenia_brevis.AAC.1
MLVTDWEEFWDRANALTARGITIQVEKAKAHTTDEALANKEQQLGNGLTDRFANMGANTCQLTESETRPSLSLKRTVFCGNCTQE